SDDAIPIQSASSREMASLSPVNGALQLTLQHPAEQLDILGQRRVAGAQLLDLLDRVDHRGVVAAAEFAPDLGQGARGQLLGEVHRDLARAGPDTRPP